MALHKFMLQDLQLKNIINQRSLLSVGYNKLLLDFYSNIENNLVVSKTEFLEQTELKTSVYLASSSSSSSWVYIEPLTQ